MNPIRRLVARMTRGHFERLGKRTTPSEMAERLEASGRTLAQRFAAEEDAPAVREVLQHVIGIERWGQQRLRVALGEPFDPRGHRPFRLEDDATLDRLRVGFTTTRADTVGLAKRLAETDIVPDLRIAHDDLGDLSVNAWLAYLDGHALIEARRRLKR